MLAAQVTDVLSPSKIAGELGLSQPTVDKYLSYLEQAFLVFLLPNYSGNEQTAQRHRRTVYFVDEAIRNAALQRGLAQQYSAPPLRPRGLPGGTRGRGAAGQPGPRRHRDRAVGPVPTRGRRARGSNARRHHERAGQGG